MSIPDLQVDPTTCALCIVEMQNDIVHESNTGAGGIGGVLAEQVLKRGVIAKIRALATACRAQGVPVCFINFCLKPGFPRPNTLLHRRSRRKPTLVEGTWGVQVHPELTPEPQDFVFERTVGIDGSYGTQLYPVLRQLKRSTLLLAGVSTNLAVEGLARASVNRGFDVVVLEDACASYPDEWHRFSIDNILPLIATVTTTSPVIARLAGSQR